MEISTHWNSFLTPIIFFFYYQQFIIWSARADRGSYFITTYNRSKLTWKKRKLEKRKRKKEMELIIKTKRKEKKRKEDKTSYKIYL